MNMTYEQLFKELQLDLLNDTMRLNALKTWCHQHLSRDIHYTGEASYSRYVELARAFLDRFIPSTQVNSTEIKADLDNLTPIQYAAYRGFDRFIESSTPISEVQLNQGNASDMTPLHLAAQGGHVHTVAVLLAKGADLTKKNKLAELPIHAALAIPLSHSEQLKKNKAIIFRKLWQSNPSTLAYKNYEGDTVLHSMAYHGYDQLIHDVLDSYPEGAFMFNNYGHYPIHAAILNNQITCAKSLLSIPNVATLADSKYRVALHYAALYGSKEIMELCCEVTDDLNICDTEGKTALILANEADNHDAQEVLAAHGIHLPLAVNVHSNGTA